MIVFENIETGETIGIKQEEEGFMAEAKISALINSSNMGVNADRGQDFGWRLAADSQATLESWKQDPEMIEKISRHTSVQVDDLNDAHFLQYMLYIEQSEHAPRTLESKNRDDAEQEYRRRVREAAGKGTKGETSDRVKEQEEGDGTDRATVKNQTPQTEDKPSAPRQADPEEPAKDRADVEKSTSESDKAAGAKAEGAKNVQARGTSKSKK